MYGGGEIVAGRGWWQQNYGWSRVVAAKLWLVVDGCGWSHNLVMPFINFEAIISHTELNCLLSHSPKFSIFTLDIAILKFF